MAKYTVLGTVHVKFEVEVEADDDEQADERAERLVLLAVNRAHLDRGQWDDADVSIRETKAQG